MRYFYFLKEKLSLYAIILNKSLCTLSAHVAFFHVVRACFPALPAESAFAFIKHDLRFYDLAFRVMTPFTPEIATLKKYCCPYTGSVNERTSLNIKYYGFHFYSFNIYNLQNYRHLNAVFLFHIDFSVLDIISFCKSSLRNIK